MKRVLISNLNAEFAKILQLDTMKFSVRLYYQEVR